MRHLKEKIIKLRSEGKTYNEIASLLNCTKSNVSYHCGTGQKEKTLKRRRKLRQENPVYKKSECFVDRGRTKSLENRLDRFQRERKGRKERCATFHWTDIINKYGMKTTCYLTGRVIDLNEPGSYCFDHIIPVSRGGTSDLDNLGICTRIVNYAKTNLTPEEFISLCKEVLIYNGYSVNKE